MRYRTLRLFAVAAVVVAGIGVGVSLTAKPIIPMLPAPTGPFLVGTVRWDYSRTGNNGGGEASPGCRLDVQLWYPAGDASGRPRAPYSWSAGVRSLRHWVRTDAVLGAPVATARASYPVVLLLPGWSGGRGENTALVQELASRGFIVAAVGYDLPGCGQVAGLSGPGGVGAMDFSSAGAFARTVEIANRRLDRVSQGAVRVVDALVALNRDDPSGRFVGRLDMDRVAAVGHSFGGAIAVQICWLDARVKAAVDIDGWLFNAAPGGWIRQPFMHISDDGQWPTLAEMTAADPERRFPAILGHETEQRLEMAFATYGGISVTVEGSRHEDFADFLYLSGSLLLLGRRPDQRFIRIAAEYVAAFLGQGPSGDGLNPLATPLPGVRLRVYDGRTGGDG
ncbi:MAG TPA: alpha/beta fold hydrolase [Acetobacteraceae bacterium]